MLPSNHLLMLSVALRVPVIAALQVHSASQQQQQRWLAIELRADRCFCKLFFSHSHSHSRCRIWSCWTRMVMARLNNVVLVCGGGAEALEALVEDGAAAAVHCKILALVLRVSIETAS